MVRLPFQNGDHVASDDLGDILEYSRQMYDNPDEGSGSGVEIVPAGASFQRSHLRKQQIHAKIANLEHEIREYDADVKKLLELIETRRHSVEELKKELRDASGISDKKGKGKQAQAGINYTHDQFDWAGGLKAQMKKVFGISSFRLCQEGVCNANIDGRDIVCVMPTGGGKSLTYQLPALLTAGCTMVISPLISLITDQILHLQEAGIEAVMLLGGTPKNEKREIMQRLRQLADNEQSSDREIKLCYVTPEKLAKDNTFVSLLSKLAEAGKLARFVIDEAHCVSQLGHDFRPDYQKLHRLRQLFPRVPIMALSATCPPQVLQDLIKILGLPPIVDGNDANADGTVYFSSPLYRKNLHYQVLPKPSKANDVYEAMVEYILKHHPNDTGIVYCFSKKDTEVCAEKIMEISKNKIRTGTYHADIGDARKAELHSAWRQGKVKVVCATIAFGLGIDKGDVRFVLHHSISKSLDGYYQESGRAGRDGKDADCILYYRPQDGSHLSTLTSNEKTGQQKLHDMLDFVEELKECRKIQFAKYFRHSAQVSITSWSTEDTDALQRCGHCDNCTRPADSIDCRDVTLAAWQLLKITSAVVRMGGKVTLNMLAGLARGAGGGKVEVTQGGKGRGKKTKEKTDIDLEAICHGPVDMSRDDIEHLLIRLLTQKYFQEEYQQTAYAINVYLVPGQMAPRLVHLSKNEVTNDPKRKIESYFLKSKKAARSKKAKAPTSTLPKKRKVSGESSKRQQKDVNESDIDEADDSGWESHDLINESVVGLYDDDDEPVPSKAAKRIQPQRSADVLELDDEDSNEDWSFNQRHVPPPRKVRRTGISDAVYSIIKEGDKDVMVLSSD